MSNKKETKKEFWNGFLTRHANELSDYEKEKILYEIELLDRKNSADRKPSKVQLENDVLRQAVYDFLCDTEKAYTVSELNKACPALAEIDASTSKTTQLLRPLKESGKIVNFMEHRKSYYKIAD
jgi:hypothetical protein